MVPAYLINLDHRADRLSAAKNATLNMGINAIRVPAVDTRRQTEFCETTVDPGAGEAIKRGYRIEHDELSSGAVGCYLSHINCWKLIKTSGEPAGLILEDDIVYTGDPDKFANVLNLAKKEVIQNEVDIFLLGNLLWLLGITSESEKIVSVNQFFGTHAYLISASACDKLLNTALPIKCQLDSFISRLNSARVLQTKAILPSLIQQSGLDTDIQSPFKGNT